MMKKLFVAFLLTLFAAHLFAQDQYTDASGDTVAPAPKVKKTKGDEIGVKGSFKKFSEAWASGDLKARVACFTYDATLINPFGVAANGREEIKKLFEDENNTIAKGTTQTFDNFKIHFVMPTFALVDCDGTVSGIKTPAGESVPDLKLHIYAVVVNRGKGWQMFAARPAVYAPMPNSGSVAENPTPSTVAPNTTAPSFIPPAPPVSSVATPAPAVTPDLTLPSLPPDISLPTDDKTNKSNPSK